MGALRHRECQAFLDTPKRNQHFIPNLLHFSVDHPTVWPTKPEGLFHPSPTPKSHDYHSTGGPKCSKQSTALNIGQCVSSTEDTHQ
jgi:hypothetical protein